ncbi:hypothetical protein AAC387_Pa11g1434 [Persea americana]
MNTGVQTRLQAMKAPLKDVKEKLEIQGSRLMDVDKTTNRCHSSRERKMALQQDVDKLRKKLRHEENIHRALERAFTRPLGALPRLPPYLPPYTLELLAEVAVLEEEVIRLEEQVVNFRKGLYQEAVLMTSSKKNIEKSIGSCRENPCKNFKPEQPKTTSQVANSEEFIGNPLSFLIDEPSGAMQLSPELASNSIRSSSNSSMDGKKPLKELIKFSAFSDDARGKENQLYGNSTKNNKQLSKQKVPRTRTSRKRQPTKTTTTENYTDTLKLQKSRVSDEETTEECSLGVTYRTISEEETKCPNQISEDILKCLSSIFMRISSLKVPITESDMLTSVSGSCECSEENDFQDPYGICYQFGRRDIGLYRRASLIEAYSIDQNRAVNSSFLIRRLKLLFLKLMSVDLRGLTHQQKLAFWINIYNSCMMNAFLKHGIPCSPQMVVALMQKATINVSGQLLNAMRIEHFILRHPYRSKYIYPKCMKNDEVTMRSIFGLDWPEPLVTFALSCGSRSSPIVRVYTASQVEKELQAAKRDYLQAAVGISDMKVAIPKLLDWYLLDFAKDVDSLLDWICLQLPGRLRKEAIHCLERGKKGSVLQQIQVIPYDFSFRYLLAL